MALHVEKHILLISSMERHSYRTLKGHQREKCCMRLGETRPCITWHDLNKI